MTGYRFTGGRVLPCEDETVIDRGCVVVESDRIAWVGSADAVPPEFLSNGYEDVDTTGLTVMPGLVDGHMHISFGEAESEEELSIYTPAEYRAIRASVDAEKALTAGVTSSCDPGGPYAVAIAVRDAIEAGLIQGPRMACAGKQITTQQGIGDGFPSWIGVPESSFGALVRNRDELLQEIRNEVKDGVNLIKIAGSGASSDEYASFRLDELELAVEESHRLGRPVTIHARSRQSVEYAARAGVDWIMHASYMDEPTLEMVLEKDIPLLPAMTLLVNTLEANRANLSPPVRDRFKRELDAAVAILSKAHEYGGHPGRRFGVGIRHDPLRPVACQGDGVVRRPPRHVSLRGPAFDDPQQRHHAAPACRPDRDVGSGQVRRPAGRGRQPGRGRHDPAGPGKHPHHRQGREPGLAMATRLIAEVETFFREDPRLYSGGVPV